MKPLRPFLLLLFFLASAIGARAVITVNGIADEDVEDDIASFTVPSEAGFTIVALLDDTPLSLDTSIEVTTPGYYELAVTKTNDSDLSEESVVIQFIVRDTSRGNSEWGLVNWTPYPTLDSASQGFGNAQLEVITPSSLPQGFAIPLIARVTDATTGAGLRLNGTLQVPEAPGSTPRILRGFGSGFLPAPAATGPTTLTPTLHALTAPKTVQIEPSTTWTTVATDITTSVDWGANARVHITSNITVDDGVAVTIGPGSVIQIAPNVDIELNGTLLINGTTSDPAYFTNVPGQNPWGGFFLRGANSEVTATGAIFTESGAGTIPAGYSSHRKEQPTFLFDTGTNGSFTDCFFIDLPGQALHGKDATVSLTNCLAQRVPTVGQFNGGAVTVTRSALIEFSRNDNIFNDDDNDGIYFTAGSHQLIESVIGWAKDDGVDAGSGSSGDVTVTGCWFEACFHEGMAWSGEGRTITVSNSVAMNCGQGIEAGWSGASDNNSPIVNVTNSLCIGNHIGLRYGDNYDWDYDGQLNVASSLSLYNDRNVWGMEWDSWNYRSEKMTIENNKLSAADSRHPVNTVFDGATEAVLLTPFSPVPGAMAGCGFGEWSTQKSLLSYDDGVTLALSEVSTRTVTIDYEVARDATILGTGTVQFAPGEIRKALTLPPGGNTARNFVRVTLTGSTASEITTPRNLFFLVVPVVPGGPQTLIAKGSDWRYLDDGSNQGEAWQDLAFDDSTWAEDAAELGYGDGDEAKVINDLNGSGDLIATAYFRHTFNVPDPSQFGTLVIGLRRDDGGIVYLNGEEEFRSNIDEGPVAYDTFTENVTSSETTYYEKSISASKLRPGANVIAVEVHQANATSSDVSFDLELIATPPQPVTFFILKNGSEVNLLWDGEDDLILQKSPFLDTGWTDLPNATSPLLLTPGDPDPRQFFRLVR